MPIVAAATIPIRVNGDRTIDILTRLKEEIRKCGCLNIGTISSNLNTPLETVREMAKSLAGDGVIECDKEYDTCCIDHEQFNSFVKRMKALSRQESST